MNLEEREAVRKLGYVNPASPENDRLQDAIDFLLRKARRDDFMDAASFFLWLTGTSVASCLMLLILLSASERLCL